MFAPVRTYPHLSAKCPATKRDTQKPGLSAPVRTYPPNVRQLREIPRNQGCPHLSAPVRTCLPNECTPTKRHPGARVVRTCPHLSAKYPPTKRDTQEPFSIENQASLTFMPKIREFAGVVSSESLPHTYITDIHTYRGNLI